MAYAGRVWTYHYSATVAGTSWGVAPDLAPSSQQMLERVTLPTGLEWTFGYETEHSWLTTPQGGRVDYHFETVEVTVGPTPNDKETLHVLDSRVVGADVWDIHVEFNPTSGFSDLTTIDTPTGSRIKYVHQHHSELSFGADLARSLSGVRLTQHVIEDANGTPRQEEHRTYQLVSTVYFGGTWYGTAEIADRFVYRDGVTHRTTYTYETNRSLLGDFHHPKTVNENSGSRITAYTYNHAGATFAWSNDLYLLGRPDSESVTVGTDVWKRGWLYANPVTDWRRPLETASEWVKGSLPAWSGVPTNYTYDARGNVATTKTGTATNDPVTSYAYRFGQVSEVRTPLHTVLRTINPDGTIASETQAGRTTTFHYDDPGGRLTAKQPPGNSAPIATTYDPAGHWVRVSRGGYYTETTLDGLGRPIATVDALGVRTTTVYDADGQVVEQSLPFTPGVGVGEVREQMTYDALGRLQTKTHPGATGGVAYAYGAGTITITDENGHETVQTWEAFGNPDEGRLVSVRDAALKTWTYTYDALDHLLTVTAPDGGGQRSWTYTTKNRLYTEIHPESGTVTFTSYDTAGRLVSKTDARRSFNMAMTTTAGWRR